MSQLLVWLVLALVIVLNAVGVFLAFLQLPGTWLIVLLMSLVAWWRSEQVFWIALALLIFLAILGEILELIGVVRGSRRAGGSKRAAILALVGSVGGAIVGTITVPLPVIGTLVGACLGAGAGSYFGDRWAGQEHAEAATAGKGAAIGRLWATVAKAGIGALMWLVAAVAIFWAQLN